MNNKEEISNIENETLYDINTTHAIDVNNSFNLQYLTENHNQQELFVRNSKVIVQENSFNNDHIETEPKQTNYLNEFIEKEEVLNGNECGGDNPIGLIAGLQQETWIPRCNETENSSLYHSEHPLSTTDSHNSCPPTYMPRHSFPPGMMPPFTSPFTMGPMQSIPSPFSMMPPRMHPSMMFHPFMGMTNPSFGPMAGGPGAVNIRRLNKPPNLPATSALSDEPIPTYQNASSAPNRLPAHKPIRLRAPKHPLAPQGTAVYFKYGEEHYPEETTPDEYTFTENDGTVCRYITNFLVYNKRGERLLPIEVLDQPRHGSLVLYGNLLLASHMSAKRTSNENKVKDEEKAENEDKPEKIYSGGSPTYPVRIELAEWCIDYGQEPSNVPFIWLISRWDIYYRLEKPAGRYIPTFSTAKIKFEIATRIIKGLQFNPMEDFRRLVSKICAAEKIKRKEKKGKHKKKEINEESTTVKPKEAEEDKEEEVLTESMEILHDIVKGEEIPEEINEHNNNNEMVKTEEEVTNAISTENILESIGISKSLQDSTKSSGETSKDMYQHRNSHYSAPNTFPMMMPPFPPFPPGMLFPRNPDMQMMNYCYSPFGGMGRNPYGTPNFSAPFRDTLLSSYNSDSPSYSDQLNASLKKRGKPYRIYSLSTPEGTGIYVKINGKPGPVTPWGAPYAVEGAREETILQLAEFLESQMRNFMEGVGIRCSSLIDTPFMQILRERSTMRRERLHLLEDAKKRAIEGAGTTAGMIAENDIAALTRRIYLTTENTDEETDLEVTRDYETEAYVKSDLPYDYEFVGRARTRRPKLEKHERLLKKNKKQEKKSGKKRGRPRRYPLPEEPATSLTPERQENVEKYSEKGSDDYDKNIKEEEYEPNEDIIRSERGRTIKRSFHDYHMTDDTVYETPPAANDDEDFDVGAVVSADDTFTSPSAKSKKVRGRPSRTRLSNDKYSRRNIR